MIPKVGNEKAATIQLEDLNLITPISSMNVTPVEQEVNSVNCLFTSFSSHEIARIDFYWL